MRILNRCKLSLVVCLPIFSGLLFPGDAAAYIDPGTTGMLSQILYVLFYGALGVFLYLLRYIKQYLASAKQFLASLFSRHL
jgi:hypothetical protein